MKCHQTGFVFQILFTFFLFCSAVACQEADGCIAGQSVQNSHKNVEGNGEALSEQSMPFSVSSIQFNRSAPHNFYTLALCYENPFCFIKLSTIVAPFLLS